MAATHPEYITTATSVGADVNYQCPCGCYAGFAFDRSVAEQDPESCCCGRTILVGREATSRLGTFLADPSTYALDEQTVTMPWGQPLPVALATPPDAAHGAHDDSPLVHHDDAGGHDEHGHSHQSPPGLVITMAPAGTVHDPVCHMDILPARAAGSLEFEGKTYYFCSRGCLLDFKDDPTAVLTAEAAYDHSQGHAM